MWRFHRHIIFFFSISSLHQPAKKSELPFGSPPLSFYIGSPPAALAYASAAGASIKDNVTAKLSHCLPLSLFQPSLPATHICQRHMWVATQSQFSCRQSRHENFHQVTPFSMAQPSTTDNVAVSPPHYLPHFSNQNKTVANATVLFLSPTKKTQRLATLCFLLPQPKIT
jgi:hypothetical protein